MNFLEGHVETRAGKTVFTADGIEIPLATYAFHDGAPLSAQAVLGVRPEHVGPNTGEGWPFSARVKVDVVEPMGSDTLVWVTLGGQNFSIRAASERAPEVGDEVTIGFDPLRSSLFDAATDKRM